MATLSDEAFDRLYGPWEPLAIADVAELLRQFTREGVLRRAQSRGGDHDLVSYSILREDL
jgi:hypothetical protein